MTYGREYGSPTAFRRALTDKLRAEANTGLWTLQQLHRQMAYDRLLERLYLLDDGWIIKGAAALLARGIGVRETIDIDIYRRTARHLAEADLRDAAGRDIADWFSFEVGVPRPIADTLGGIRLPVTALIGTIVWVTFHVDLVGTELRMTGQPEDVPPLARVAIRGVTQHGYRAYPLVDHIADKVAAMFELYGPARVPSTRYKDLVDLVAIVLRVDIEAEPQTAAIQSELERRRLQLPAQFAVPDRESWERGYPREARRSLLRIGRTVDEAVAVVKPFLDPLLDGTASGLWVSHDRRWVS